MSKSWGMWIRTYCKKHGLTYDEFYQHFEDNTGEHCPAPTARNWIYDRSVPRKLQQTLSNFLNMNPDDVLGATLETERLRKEKNNVVADRTQLPSISKDEIDDYPYRVVQPGRLMRHALNRREQNFKAYWFADLFKAGLSPFQLAKELWTFSEDWPIPDLDNGGNAMGSDRIWGDIYSVSPMTGVVIKNEAEDIVGFWHFVPVYKKVYERIIKGENVNNYIGPDDIEVFDGPGDYYIYFVDAFRDPSLDLNPSFKMLFSGTLQTCLLNCAESGEFVSKIVTHASTQQAIAFCIRSGFEPKGDHKTHRRFQHDDPNHPPPYVPTEIWELDISRNVHNRFISKDADLLDRYTAHFPA